MSDIDFDEIDKAVNSAVVDDAFSPGAQTTASVEPPAPSDALPPREQQAEVATVAPPAAVSPPAIRRSSGRFMDVVHPSSDMRTPSVAAPVSVRPLFAPRPEVAALSPVAEESTAPPTATAPDPSANMAIKTPELPEESTELDFEDEVKKVFTSNEPPLAPNDSEERTDSPAQYVSPFLENTNVEKRPLGARADIGNELPSPQPDESLPLSTDSANEPADDQRVSILGALAVESPAKGDGVLPDAPLSRDMPDEAKAIASDNPVDPENGPANMIAPQYASQAGAAPGALTESPTSPFDAGAYERPREGKRSHAWIWILLAIIVVLLGVGAGAYLYFSGLL